MKTALQELKEDLQESINGLPDALKDINDLFVRKTVTDAVLIAYNCVLKRIDGELLGKEKQQIIDAVKYGFLDAVKPSSNQDISFDEYYSKTFKQE